MKKFELEKLVRDEVRRVEPYYCPRYSYPDAELLLDQNENSFGSSIDFDGEELNRYPDSESTKLRDALADYLNEVAEESSDGNRLGIENIIVGNGSDDVIDLVTRTFAGKGDNVVCLDPGYSVYDECATIAGAEVKKVLLDEEFQPDVDAILAAIDGSTKIIVVISPNSPAGNAIEWERIRRLLEESGRVVVVDEAYGEYVGKTVAATTREYPNLVVIKTLSKGWGLAGLRVGYAVVDSAIIGLIRRIKQPYNVDSISGNLAVKALANRKRMEEMVSEMKREKNLLEAVLRKLGMQVFATVANFTVFRMPDEYSSKKVQEKIAENGVVVRDRSLLPRMENCIRVTVGTRKENEAFLKALKEAMNESGKGALLP